GDAQVLAGDARPEGERVVGGRRVIRAAGSGAAGNIDLHRDGAEVGRGSGRERAEVAAVVGAAVGARATVKLAGTGRHVVVGDGQHGRSRSNQRRAAGHVLKG